MTLLGAHRARSSVAIGAIFVAAQLGGCAAARSPAPGAREPSSAATAIAGRWYAPLPHGGELTQLARWWQQFDDPTLLRLLDAAQAASPSVAQAASRIEQSRAARVASGAAFLPSLDASASANRGRPELAFPRSTGSALRLQAAWEIDVFGGRRAARDATQARLDSAEAAWHAARVSVAAEVATSYTTLRACEAQLLQSRADTASRAETARLTELTAKAGFQAPADAALARASAAQSQVQLSVQALRCEREIKSLVALTGLTEAALREQLAIPAVARIPQPAGIAVASVPADALAQRPDVLGASYDVIAAGADIAQVAAQRYPRIGLNGQIGTARISTAAGSLEGSVWNVGPVTVTLPLFDAGMRRANNRAALARYDEAAQLYAATLRRAVREVEEALARLASTAERSGDAERSVEGFEAALRAAEARFSGGLGSLFELEDARRSTVQARAALIDLQRERTSSWIALYRALGGGWRPEPIVQ